MLCHRGSGLHKVKYWLLDAAEQDRNKTLNENSDDILQSFLK